MTAIVTVANRKPMSLNPLRSAIAMLRLTEKSNVGAEKTFLKNCGCEYCVKFDLQPLLLIHAESRRQLDEFCITPAAAPAWAKVACRQFPNVEYGHDSSIGGSARNDSNSRVFRKSQSDQNLSTENISTVRARKWVEP
jgi:hypothetical protein